MPAAASDPYQTLGVSASASDADVRAAYRRLVQLHHPDHNDGSAESARRFEEVQDAYARIRALRASGSGTASRPRAASGSATASGAGTRARSGAAGPTGPRTAPVDPDLEARLKDLEQELKDAHEATERAKRAAQEAVKDATGRPSDEELGYIKTDDSFGKILADARDEIADRLSGAKEHPVAKRVSDLIDELEQLTSKFTGDSKRSSSR
jgi:curved DNA-binding protein CbpA